MNRYYQPTDAKDAMRYIEKLFNRYKDAPLTAELLAYHQKLIQQLTTNIIPVATREHNQQRVTAANNMVLVMQQWTRTKLNGAPFNGRMHHFQFEATNARPRFKRHVIKGGGNFNFRSARH